jgi:hypothetical protein
MNDVFERALSYETDFPIYKVTESKKSVIHRFYDTSPISPSGNYIALCEISNEIGTRISGEKARIYVVDLKTGSLICETYTYAWDTQLGAQVQWGSTDQQLFYNDFDIENKIAYGIKFNIFENVKFRLNNTVYMISPCGRYSITPCLLKISNVQKGYGIILDDNNIPKNLGAEDNDGLHITSTETGQTKILISFNKIYNTYKHVFFDIRLDQGAFYGFHTKWSPDGQSILFLVRWLEIGKKHTKNYLFTMDKMGNNLRLVVDAKRWKGGHHPNWCNDNKNIVMNLMFHHRSDNISKCTNFLEKVCRRLNIRYFSDISQLRISMINHETGHIEIYNDLVYGSGHPTSSPDNKYVITDCYPNERVSLRNGIVPIRAISKNKVKIIAKLNTKPKFTDDPVFRIDPHPAWSRDGKYLVVNARDGDYRGVYIIDITNGLEF